MAADLQEKTDRYEEMLLDAVSIAECVSPDGTPLASAAEEFMEMAEAYLADGQHFRKQNDMVNALAAFTYGYGWLDAGTRMGILEMSIKEDFSSI